MRMILERTRSNGSQAPKLIFLGCMFVLVVYLIPDPPTSVQPQDNTATAQGSSDQVGFDNQVNLIHPSVLSVSFCTLERCNEKIWES